MPRRLKPTSYVVNGDCSPKCSVNVANLGPEKAQIVHGWYEAGINDFKMEELARAAGFKLSHGALGRHRRLHITDKNQIEADESLADLDDIEALDLILKRGQTQIHNWKLTPSEYFKAMEMKYRLTQGSTMDAMYAAMAAAGSDEEEDDDGPEEESGPQGLEDVGEGPRPIRESLPVEWATPGAGEVAEE